MKDNTQNQNNEELAKAAGLLIGFVLFVFTAPVVILSGAFSYLVWASYYEREERKLIRSFIIGLLGFLITKSVYQSFYDLLPALLSGFATQTKIKNIMATSIVKNASFGYFPLLACGVYIFQNKINRGIQAYSNLREVAIKSFYPFKVILHLSSVAVSLVAGLFGVKLGDNQSVTSVVFSFIVLTAASKLFIALPLALSHGTPFYLVAGGISSTYVALFWYYYLSSKWRIDNKTSFNIKKIKDGIHIGRLLRPRRMDLNLSWSDLNHHIHILGQPGSGKSILLRNIYAHQVRAGSGLLMIDLKADMSVREDFKNLAAETCREKDLMIIDLSHPESSYGYNPLQFGNATELKDKIIGAIDWSEPHYKRASEQALLIILKALVWLRDQKQLMPTLSDVVTALSSIQGLTILSEMVESQDIKQNISTLIIDKEFLKNTSGLKAELGLLTMSEFGSIFSKSNSLNVFDAILNKKVILVNLDGQTFSESAKKFGRMLIGDLRSASGAVVTNIPKEERPQFTVIVDEFSDIMSNDEMAKNFVGFLNRCRGSGIGVVIAHQSLGDFKEETTKKQVLDSTETIFSFVTKDPETAETLAAIAGTELQWKVTEQTSENILFKSKTGMGTQREVHEYLVHPNEFKMLNTGEAIYIAKKPSRFGTVKVEMQEIPESDFRIESPISKEIFLRVNLHSVIHSNKERYSKSFANQKTDLEI